MNQAVMFGEADEPQAGASFISYLPVILWQRRWLVLAPLILGLVAALVAIALMSAQYKSRALMLVQSPQLAGDITGQTTSEAIDRRLARIRQQVTSRPDLIALIEKHGLYKEERSTTPLSEVLEKMRDAIAFTPTAVDTAGGQAGDKTVSVELSFQYKEPGAAQAVAQELMERILELDQSGNAEQATNTVQFLTQQAKSLEDQIASVQGEISGINARNGNILSRSGVMLGGNGGSYDVQIASLQRDNASLIAQKDVARTSNTRDPVVVAAETQLASARAVYAESHPDVAIAKQRLAEARELAKSNTQKLPTEVIDQQIQFNNSQIAALRAAKAGEVAQLSSQLNAQARAPLVQQQISDLQQRLTGLNTQYEAVSARLLAARAGVRAENEQMGQRLAVVDPPVIPDAPFSPNRLLIVALGIGGGLGAGLLLALAIELMLRPIRDPAAISAITGQPPLAVVPVISANASKRASHFKLPSLRRNRRKSA